MRAARGRLKGYLARLRPRLFPFHPTEDGDIVTYHRHWIVLARNTALPLLVCLGELAAWVYLVATGGLPGLLGAGWGPNLGLLALSALPWGWLLWRYEDWRNDYYVVASDRIVDVDRRPFGFGGEVREAPMANVQNVSMRIPNFMASALDFGDIEVETAGRQGGLVFHSIHHPREVMARVAAKVDAFREERLAREHEARQRELATWFSLYADLNRVAIVQSPPTARVGEVVEVAWRVSGQATEVETWLEWRLGEAAFRTAQQAGGPGNYLGTFTAPLAREVPFSVGALIAGGPYQSPPEILVVSDFELLYPPETPPGRPLAIRWRHAAPANQAEVLWDIRSHGREDAYPHREAARLEGGWWVSSFAAPEDEAVYFRLRAQMGGALLHSPEHKVTLSVSGGHVGEARQQEAPRG